MEDVENEVQRALSKKGMKKEAQLGKILKKFYIFIKLYFRKGHMLLQWEFCNNYERKPELP